MEMETDEAVSTGEIELLGWWSDENRTDDSAVSKFATRSGHVGAWIVVQDAEASGNRLHGCGSDDTVRGRVLTSARKRDEANAYRLYQC